MTWIQQLLIERYLPLVENNVSNVMNYSIELFHRYVNYQITVLSIWLLIIVTARIILLSIAKRMDDEFDKDAVVVLSSIFAPILIIIILIFLLKYIFIPEIAVYDSLIN